MARLEAKRKKRRERQAKNQDRIHSWRRESYALKPPLPAKKIDLLQQDP
jgi:hypothetical protein